MPDGANRLIAGVFEVMHGDAGEVSRLTAAQQEGSSVPVCVML